jgi:hypothetical protein
MKPGFKLMTVLLGILGVGDLAMVPFMIAANHHTAGTPPVPARAAAIIIGVATLASAVGVAQARRWAFPVAMTCRILDSISSALGLVARPSVVLTAGGAVGLVLSIAAIVMLIRLNPRRILRRAAGGTAADMQPEPSRGPAH